MKNNAKLLDYSLIDIEKNSEEAECLMKWKHVFEEEGMDLLSNDEQNEIMLGFYKETEGLAIIKFVGNRFSFELFDNASREKRKLGRKRCKNLEEALKVSLPSSQMIFEQSRIDRPSMHQTHLTLDFENQSMNHSRAGEQNSVFH